MASLQRSTLSDEGTAKQRVHPMTGPPAAGKSCLMSQLVMHALGRAKKGDESVQESELIGKFLPILVKVQELQRLLLMRDNKAVFASKWN